MTKKIKPINLFGFSLIEVSVGLFIIMILSLGIFELINISLKLTAENKNYVNAIEIANQRMERIRNLAYEDVGTLSGSPHGPIQDYETLNRDGQFLIHTTIIFEDDPYDGTDALGTDFIFLDYKIATVNVSWMGKFGPKNVILFSKFIPNTMETLSGYGILRILSVNANGQPVANANVNIKNTVIIPNINVDLVTNSDGVLVYPVLPSFENYEVTVAKAGYSTEKTYPRSVLNPNPTKVNLSVYNGARTEESFSIDLMSVLDIYTLSQSLPNNWKVNNDSSLESQVNSRLAFDNSGFVYLIWQDARQTGQYKIYAQKYNDSGVSQWASDIVVGTANNQILPDILTDNSGNLYICWNDNSIGNQDVYLTKLDSADGDDLWGGRKVDTDADNKDQTHGRIALSSALPQTTLITFEDDRTGSLDIYYQKLDTTGNELLSPELRVNTNLSTDGTDQYDPAIINDKKDDVYIAWTDNRSGNNDIYAAKYSSSTVFIHEFRVDTDVSATEQYESDLIVDSGNYLYTVWTDERNGNKDIYAQKYDEDGNKIWASDKKLNSDAGNYNQYSPSIAIDKNDIIYTTWTDERNGNKDIYAQKYDTDGNKLWPDDLRVNINTGTSDQYNSEVTINPINDIPYTTWTDERNGNDDIYISSISTYGASSNIGNIPLNIKGTKQLGDNPVIYKLDQNFTSDGSGFISIPVEFDTPGYTITTNSALTTKTILISYPAFPMKIDPDQTTSTNLIISP